MNEGFCWAAPLGECEGPITSEHLVSKTLLGKKVFHRIGNDPLHGDGSVYIKHGALTAHILCEKHNQELGGTADDAARQLLSAFRAMRTPMSLRGARILRPVTRQISGVNYGRWLCKTHCDLMFAFGTTPHPAYVRYAFLRPLPNPVHFYLPAQVGQNLPLGNRNVPVVSWRRYTHDGEPEFDAFSVALSGYATLVSVLPLRQNGESMIDRLGSIRMPIPVGEFRISFNWSGEPAVQGVS